MLYLSFNFLYFLINIYIVHDNFINANISCLITKYNGYYGVINEKEVINLLDKIEIEIKNTPNGDIAYLNGQDVSKEIREKANVNIESIAITPIGRSAFLFLSELT